MQNILNIMGNSVQPKVPSIIETTNLPIFTFSRNTCENLKQDQKTQLLNQIKNTRQKITDFRKNVSELKVTADA